MHDAAAGRASRPVIGITPDVDAREPASETVYVLRRNYADAVIRAGGLPLILPYGENADVIELVDGLLVSGGFFDIDPALYGEAPAGGEPVLKKDRTAFELALVRRALELDMPVLGVCGGMQLIAVAMQAKLIQDIPSAMAASAPGRAVVQVEHFQSDSCDRPSHPIEIVRGSLLHHVLGATHMDVNSVHHQSVHRLPPGLRASAIAPDGIVEAIEARDASFCIGVQWHPEYGASPHGREARLFDALVSSSARRAGRSKPGG